MTFLNPLFLLGTISVLLPIIIHLFHRQKKKEIQFSSNMFLKTLIKRRLHHFRLKSLLLLLLRIFSFLLISFAFSRPVLRGKTFGKTTTLPSSSVFLIDDSYSMSYRTDEAKTLFDLAKEKTLSILSSILSPKDQLFLHFFSDTIDSPSYSLLNIKEALKEKKKPEDSEADLYTSLSQAIELLRRNSKKEVWDIYCFSDFQKTSLRTPELKTQNPKIKNLTLYCFLPPKIDTENYSIEEFEQKGQIPSIKKNLTLLATSHKYKGLRENSNEIIATLIHNNKKSKTQAIQFKHGALQSTSFSIHLDQPGIHELSLSLQTDRLLPDNKRYLKINIPSTRNVIISSENNTSSFYLSKALSPLPQSPFSVQQISTSKLQFEDLSKTSLIILSDISILTQPLIISLERFINDGGGLMIFLGEETPISFLNRILLPKFMPSEILSQEKAEEGNFFSISDYEESHPIFQIFSKEEDKRGNVSLIKFYKIWKLKPKTGTKTIAKFTDGSPAILEYTIKNGKVLLFPFSLNTLHTNLPLSSLFVPMIHEASNYLCIPSQLRTRSELVGSKFEITLPIESAGKTITLFTPDSQRIFLSPIFSKEKPHVTIPRLTKAGFYKLYSGEKLLDEFAVNVNTERESNLIPASEQEIKKFLIENLSLEEKNIKLIKYNESIESSMFLTQGQTELWKFFLAFAMLLLLFEMLLRDRKT